MPQISVGDLVHSFHLRRQNTALKTDLARLTDELASGRVHDKAKALSGDFTQIGGIEASLRGLEAYKTTAAEAKIISNSMQHALTGIQESSSDLGPALLATSNSKQPAILAAASINAREVFDAVVANLNTQSAGRSIFAGNTIGQPALASSEEILSGVKTLVSGLTEPQQILGVIDDWFAAGGGFETDGYQGTVELPSAFRLGPEVTSQLSVTASDPSIRSVLKGFVIASLAGDAGTIPDSEARFDLMQSAAETMIASQGDIAVLQAKVGAVEARIEEAQTTNQAHKSALMLARESLIGIDPYERATKLEATQTQLETLYTLTSRLSRLSLADYLR